MLSSFRPPRSPVRIVYALNLHPFNQGRAYAPLVTTKPMPTPALSLKLATLRADVQAFPPRPLSPPTAHVQTVPPPPRPRQLPRVRQTLRILPKAGQGGTEPSGCRQFRWPRYLGTVRGKVLMMRVVGEGASVGLGLGVRG